MRTGYRSLHFFATLIGLLALAAFPALANHLSYPPSPLVKVAVNPITNKIYTVNEFADTVTVTNGATGASATIPVGPRPQFVVANPVTNRVYVNNGGNATVTVIDGATDTNLTPTPLALGSHGAMAVNPLTNTIYVVRQTGLGTDEVSFLDGNTHTWYTIATESYQPIAVAVNPITNTLYVAHYGTGDVRIISAANDGNAHPVTTSVGVWSHPMGIAVNPATNKVYVVTEDSRGPIAIIDGATRTATFPALASGHGVGGKAVAVNSATNKVYAAFNGELVVLDGNTNALAYIAVPTGGGQVAIGINYTTNRIYVTTNNGVVSEIDGDTNAVLGTKPIAPGAGSVGVNSLTNKVYAMGDTLSVVDGSGTARGNPLTTAISPLPNNTSDGSATFTFTPSSAYSPNRMPVRGVYYQLDSTGGAWTAAAGSGPYTASFSGLAAGTHTIYAIAADGQDAPLSVSHQSNPLTGTLAAYTFTVGTVTRATPGVSLASSANPSSARQSVTFTAVVTGSSGTPTGTVDFRDGGVSIAGCSAVSLTNGSAACTTSALAAGSHSITAQYSGDSSYTAASSGTVTQVVNSVVTTPTIALTSSLNPSNAGQSVTFRATLAGDQGTPTGTVDFLDGGVAIGGCTAVALSSGVANCATASLAAGSHAITTRYSGSSSYNAVTSTALTQTVNGTKVTPSVTLTTSMDPAPPGQAIVFTATLTGSAGTVTGTVAFKDGSAAIAGCEAVALSGGRATCTTATLAPGNHSIAAQYAGSSAYNAVTSRAIKQTVRQK